MEGVKFVDVLRSFEERVEGESYERSKNSYDERRIIENDVRRTTFIGVEKDGVKVKALRKILFESLDRMPNRYTQGMSEIGSVFVLHYFEEIVDQEMKNDVPEEESGMEQRNSMAINSSDQFIDVPEDERIKFEEFESRYRGQMEKLTTVITNVFRRKFEPLIADDFRLYKDNMKVFVAMMKNRGVRISELESHRFMGCIFTFFLRNMSDREDVHKLFEIILSCPNTCPFLLLVIFYSKISNNGMIGKVDDGIFPSIVELEEEFINTERMMNDEKSGFSVKNALLFGGAVSLLAAVFVYRMSKKE